MASNVMSYKGLSVKAVRKQMHELWEGSRASKRAAKVSFG
jgi:hypothetical protein